MRTAHSNNSLIFVLIVCTKKKTFYVADGISQTENKRNEKSKHSSCCIDCCYCIFYSAGHSYIIRHCFASEQNTYKTKTLLIFFPYILLRQFFFHAYKFMFNLLLLPMEMITICVFNFLFWFFIIFFFLYSICSSIYD